MGIVHVPLRPHGASYHTSSINIVQQSSGASIVYIGFDDGGTEYCVFILHAVRFGGGYITLDIDWYSQAVSTGDVYWAADVAVLTPETDTTDIETLAFGGRHDVVTTHPGVDAQRLQRATLTLSNLNGLAEDDWYALRIYRDSDDALDTQSFDAHFVYGNLSYADSES